MIDSHAIIHPTARLASNVGVDATVQAIKSRLEREHGLSHVTVEAEFGTCADQ